MRVHVIIVGQGISGTWLSFYLQQANISFVVIDETRSNTASRIAAGLINPVTGRRIVKTWMIDELLPFVRDAYADMGKILGMELLEEKRIIDFFPTPQMKLAFNSRHAEDREYLQEPANENEWRNFFNYEFGFGELLPAYLVKLPSLLPAWRTALHNRKCIREELFDQQQLIVQENNVRYRDIEADRIVFCDGLSSSNSPWFKNLPFAPNKGEVLWIETAEPLPSLIFKKGISLIPWQGNIYWIGSSYEWNFDSAAPTESFRQKMEVQLKNWLKMPFRIVDHQAAVRPATLERRPFVGFHPVQKNVGILNGMGTKGCSLAPYFAKQLSRLMLNQEPLHPDADISRFTRILSR
jgi:glycine/D-amino acid oxidase-like deaminating enzyme